MATCARVQPTSRLFLLRAAQLDNVTDPERCVPRLRARREGLASEHLLADQVEARVFEQARELLNDLSQRELVTSSSRAIATTASTSCARLMR